MDNESINDELMELLDKLGVKIRKDALGGSGSGLCEIKGVYTFFVDTDSAVYDNAVCCAKAITENFDIESIFVRPQVRAFIEQSGFTKMNTENLQQ